VETTHKGSSAGFDTTLFIYGPKASGFGGSSIVKDNNDGWGRLSKIDDFRLFEGGQYLIVVGTPSAQGRGRYRLLVTCPGENCEPAVEDVPTDTCPDEIEDNILECVQETKDDLEVDRQAALSICLDQLDVLDMYEGLCFEDAFTTPPAWCAGGADKFSEGYLPTCTTRITEALSDTGPDIGLHTLALNEELEQIQEAAWDACDDFCAVQINAYNYDVENPSIVTIVDALRSTIEFEDADWDNRGASSAALIQGIADDMELGDVLTPAKALGGGGDFEVGLGTYSDTPWPSVDASGSVYVMHFPDTKALVVFDYAWFSE